jgi:hypothetical protein
MKREGEGRGHEGWGGVEGRERYRGGGEERNQSKTRLEEMRVEKKYRKGNIEVKVKHAIEEKD